MIDGICQSCMMGFSLHDPVAFSRSLGDRSRATQASQHLVIPCLDRASERRVAATELPIPGIDNRISTSGGADLDEGACQTMRFQVRRSAERMDFGGTCPSGCDPVFSHGCALEYDSIANGFGSTADHDGKYPVSGICTPTRSPIPDCKNANPVSKPCPSSWKNRHQPRPGHRTIQPVLL